ncbi:MAG: antitoxin [Candidatus Bathyarchaeia archaeon]
MSVTISVRIPERLKRMLEEMNIDWYREIQIHLERLVRDELRKRVLSSSDEVRRTIGRMTTSTCKLIREDREYGH